MRACRPCYKSNSWGLLKSPKQVRIPPYVPISTLLLLLSLLSQGEGKLQRCFCPTPVRLHRIWAHLETVAAVAGRFPLPTPAPRLTKNTPGDQGGKANSPAHHCHCFCCSQLSLAHVKPRWSRTGEALGIPPALGKWGQWQQQVVRWKGHASEHGERKGRNSYLLRGL